MPEVYCLSNRNRNHITQEELANYAEKHFPQSFFEHDGHKIIQELRKPAESFSAQDARDIKETVTESSSQQ